MERFASTAGFSPGHTFLTKPTIVLGVILVLFLAVLGYLITSSLSRRAAPTFLPTPFQSRARGFERSGTTDTLTVDARDERRWSFVDLDAGLLLAPPDTGGWDLAVRRYNIIAAVGLADAGPAGFDTLASGTDSGYIANTAGRDTANPAIRRWYSYNLFSHLLEPKGHVYRARTSEGRQVKLEVLSYYCPRLEAGCMTFRYGALQ
jgi:hypothetical protein